MAALLEAVALARQWVDEGSLVVLLIVLWRLELLRRTLTPTVKVVRVLELGHQGAPEAHRELPEALAAVKVDRR